MKDERNGQQVLEKTLFAPSLGRVQLSLGITACREQHKGPVFWAKIVPQLGSARARAFELSTNGPFCKVQEKVHIISFNFYKRLLFILNFKVG
jgi:hypothetical protein